MTETEPTFCGDLDVETGDCDLMFLAEEPADKERRGGGQDEQRAHSNEGNIFSPIHCNDTA